MTLALDASVFVKVCARASKAMLVGHSVNDLCKFLLLIQKKQKGGMEQRLASDTFSSNASA